MKIDLHVHSVERSACAVSGEEEQILAAIACGLDALVFTDHERLVAPEHIETLNRRYAPFRIFGAIEITVQEQEDVLVLGLHDPVLESGRWTYPALHAFVREHDGWLAIAHPFRYHPTINLDLERYPPDALEGCSMNIPPAKQPPIRDLAARLGIPVVCNSDAHVTQSLGVAYNDLHETPADERVLIDLLRTARFSGVCMLS